MMITDADAVIEYVNPAFAKIAGYRTDEVIGLTPTMLNSGRHDDAFFQRFWQQIACGETWHGSLVNKRKDGSVYPALMSVAPIFDDRNGSITHYVSVQQDMSAHEELEEKFLQVQKKWKRLVRWLPVMGGMEAAERLRELQPDLPILLLSGYEKELLPTDKPMMTNITVLTKPIDPVELSIRIHKSMVTTQHPSSFAL